MADPNPEAHTALLLSSTEKRVLELHDRLQELQRQIALLKAQRNYATGTFISNPPAHRFILVHRD